MSIQLEKFEDQAKLRDKYLSCGHELKDYMYNFSNLNLMSDRSFTCNQFQTLGVYFLDLYFLMEWIECNHILMQQF